MTSAPLQISTDLRDVDIDVVHRFLTESSTWARGIDRARVERGIRGSLCFGGYLRASTHAPRRSTHAEQRPTPDSIEQEQASTLVAFARVITDRATFAYLADVFVVAQHRGHGHARALMRAMLGHPDLQGLRRFMLATSDAHRLYAGFGFTPPARPQTLMERFDPDVYSRDTSHAD